MKYKFNFIDKNQGSIKDDILSGLTVALALVPEAVAFAFVAGVSPIIGLYGAFMMGLVTSILGGRITSYNVCYTKLLRRKKRLDGDVS